MPNIKMPNIIKTGVNINSCLLVELMFLLDKNLSSGENQNIKDLEIEIKRMWHLKPTLIPVVMGALGTVKKGTNEYSQQIPGKLV